MDAGLSASAIAALPVLAGNRVGAFVMAIVATVVAVAALVVVTTRSPASGSAPTTSATIYSAAEVAAAHQKLCDAYKLAARAVQMETNGKNSDRANLATANGALTLEHAVNANPAITTADRGCACPSGVIQQCRSHNQLGNGKR
ncbi:hypothetical protein MPRI_18440 [Mycobacterium paraintracellulare]|uniref:Uncharacterized protein n=1 Tax=Mycobacterium paraintracellulare TaxID=1138383 RepID=A0ABN6APC3_9MYCO|nr:hypothetical protein MPRI_18440 [Mycobacterium paraintracellulare]